MEDTKPTHMLDMLKCVRTTSRTTWLAATQGGQHTTVPCTRVESALTAPRVPGSTDPNDTVIVRVMRGEEKFVFGAPADALTEIPSVPTLPRAERGVPKPVEHAPLPVKTTRSAPEEGRDDPPTKRHRTNPPTPPQDGPRKRRGAPDGPDKG